MRCRERRILGREINADTFFSSIFDGFLFGPASEDLNNRNYCYPFASLKCMSVIFMKSSLFKP